MNPADHPTVRRFQANAEKRSAPPSIVDAAWLRHLQTWPKQTLLVNSKTLWMATLHPTVEGQRDRDCYVKQCSSTLSEIQWPRLNQQSQSNLYTSAEIIDCTRHALSQ
jgi:hypothetical protein